MANEFIVRKGLIVVGNETISGSSISTDGYTGSLFGTASYASQSLSSSYASQSLSSSYSTQALSASYWSGSVRNAASASYASYAVQATTATTASYLPNVFVNGDYYAPNAVFGQRPLRSQIVDNVLYQADSRFVVTVSGSGTRLGNNLFNGNYDQTGINIPTSSIATYNIAFTGSGGSPITYTEGYVYLHFYSTSIPAGVSGRVQSNAGVWRDITGWTNVSTNSSFAVWRGNVPSFNYMTDMEISITSSAGINAGWSQWEYVMNRPGQYEWGVISKMQNNNLWTNLTFRNSTNGSTISIAASGNIGTTGSISAGKISPNPSSKLDVSGNTLLSGSVNITGSITVSGSVINTLTSSYSVSSSNSISASYAATASYANNFTVGGTLTAQTIVVQTITSSTDYVTGSSRFGSTTANTHQFTGSVSISGSLALNGSNVITTNQTSSMSVLSASYAATASYIISSSYAATASYLTPLNQTVILTGSLNITGSGTSLPTINPVGSFTTAPVNALRIAGDLQMGDNNTSTAYMYLQSFYNSATISNNTYWANIGGSGYTHARTGYFGASVYIEPTGVIRFYNTRTTGSAGTLASLNNPFTVFQNGNITIGYFTAASSNNGYNVQINGSPTASGSLYVSGSFVLVGNETISGSLIATGGITGSLLGTASYATQALSASYFSGSVSDAITASYASQALSSSYAVNSTSASYALNATSASYSPNALSASYAATSSYANNFTVGGTLTAQTLVVQTVTSSITYSSGSNIFGSNISNTQTFTGSLNVTGSNHTIYGNVGIGITGSSTYRLNVNGISRTATGLVVGNELGGYVGSGAHRVQIVATGSMTPLMIAGGSGAVEIWKDNTPTKAVSFGMAVPGTAITDDFVFATFNGTSWAEKMRIANGGNIGIGTTAPGANLVVQNTSGTSIPSLGTSGGHFQLQNGSYGLLAGVATSGNAWMQVGRTDSTATAYNLLLQPNGGNILVGTATDAGYKLDVNGTGRFNGNVSINGTIIGADQTYGTPYRTFAFGSNANGYNRIWATTDDTDGMYFSAATGRGFNFRPNGGTTNTFTIASTGAATFSSNITTATANQFNIPNGVYNASFYSSEVATTGYNIVRVTAAFTSAIGYYGIGGSSTANTSFRDTFVVGTQNAYDLNFNTNDTKRVNINGSTGAATFSSAVYASQFSGNTYPYNSIFGNGTDASYSILYAGSTNSYVSSVTVNGGGTGTPNTIIMQTASTERMRITSGGNLLINTTTDAGYKLQVNGTSRFYDSVRVDATSSSGYGLSAVGSSGGARQIFLAGQVGYSNGFTVDYNGTNMVYQMLNGNLTVGGAVIAGTATSTIGSIILQGAYSAGALTNLGSMYSSGGPVLGYAVTPSTSADESFLSATNVTIARGAYYIQGGAHIWYAGSSQSVAIGSAVSMSERMRIAAGGNVGIGTTSPSTLLDVYNSQASGISEIAKFRYNNAGTGGALAIANQAGTTLGQIAIIGDSGGTSMSFYAYNNSTALTERMRITSGGNVLIGTTTDAGYKFDVNGSFRASGVIAINGNTGLPSSAGGVIYLASGYSSPDSGRLFIGDGTGWKFFMSVRSSGTTTDKFTFNDNGNMTAAGSITATSFFESSDATLKTLITDNYQVDGIENVVAKLYIKNGKQEVGYFAQDVQTLLPSSVSSNDAGILSLSYTQVHTAKIASLEQRVKQLEERLKQYEA